MNFQIDAMANICRFISMNVLNRTTKRYKDQLAMNFPGVLNKFKNGFKCPVFLLKLFIVRSFI